MTVVVRKVDLSGGFGEPVHAVGPLIDASVAEWVQGLRDRQPDYNRSGDIGYPLSGKMDLKLFRDAAALAGDYKASVRMFADEIWLLFPERSDAFAMKRELNA